MGLLVKAWFIRGYMESQKSLGYWKGRNCNIGSMLRCGRKHYVGDILSCDDIRSPDTFIMSDKGGMVKKEYVPDKGVMIICGKSAM